MRSSPSILDRLSIATVVIAALLMALDQAISSSPNFKAAFPSVSLSGATRFLPLALLTAGGLLWLIANIRRSASAPAPAPALQAAQEESKAKVPVTNVQPRVFVKSGTTPERMIAPFADHLEFQAKKLIEPYLNKWIVVSGPFWDASDAFESILVDFRDFYKNYESSYHKLGLSFKSSYKSKIEIIHRNDQVVILGRIDRITKGTVWLADCEFVDGDPPGWVFELPLEPPKPSRTKRPRPSVTKPKAKARAPTASQTGSRGSTHRRADRH